MGSALHPANPKLFDEESSLCKARAEPDVEYSIDNVEEKIV